jgi:PAS domain S-box-containing protein
VKPVDYRLQDLVDIPVFQGLQDRLSEIYPFPSAIIDNEGNVLTATAWQDVCTKFHRTHPEVSAACRASDQYILSHIGEAKPAVTYRCPHGLVDNAIPIVIGGKHLANYFTGQFFLEPPDLDFFRGQAAKYGFDEEAYLAAVARVPVWSKEKLDRYLDFMKAFTEVLADVGLRRQQELEARRMVAQQSGPLREMSILDQQVVESMKEGVIVYGPDLRYLAWNPFMEEFTGKKASEVIGRRTQDVFPFMAGLGVIELQERALRGEAQHPVDVPFQESGGRSGWASYACSPLLSADGQIVGVIATLRDISEQKRAEEALRQNEERFRAVIERSTDMVLLLDGEGRFTFWSPSATESLGWSAEEALGRSAFEFIHPDDAPAMAEAFRSLEGRPGATTSLRARFRSKSGAWRVNEGSGRNLLDHPVVGAVVVNARDTTEFRALEEQAQQAQRTLLMITRCNEAILRARTEEELFADVCKLVVEVGGYRMCWVGIAEDDERKTVRPVAHAGHEDGYLQFADIVWADELRGRGTTGTAIREKRMVVGQDFSSEPSKLAWREEALRRGYRSVNSLPLLLEGKALGAIVMYSSSMAAFSGDELRFLSQFTDDVAFGVGAIRQRLAKDTAVAERERAAQTLSEEQGRFQALIEHSTDVTLVIDAKGIITFISPSALDVLGIPPSEVTGRPASQFIHPDDQARAAETLGALISGREKTQRHELRVRRAGGGWATLEAVRTAMLDHPLIRGIVVNSRDITERIEAERQLRDRERLLETVVTTALDGFWVVDGDGRLLDVNPAYCAMSGYSREELLRMRISDLEAVETPEETAARIQRLREHGFDRFETRQRRKDGTVIDIAAAIRLIGLDRTLMVGFFQDITARKAAQEAQSASERRLKQLIRALPVALAVNDRNLRITAVNDKFVEITGYTLDDVPDVATWFRLSYPDVRYRAEATQVWGDAVRRANGGEIPAREYRVACKDGKTRTLEISGVPVGEDLLVTLVDVTGRVEAEAAVRSSEALLRAIANSSPDSIFAKNQEGRWTFANAAALQVVGKPAEEVLGRTNAEIFGNPALVSTLTSQDRDVLETGNAQSFEEVINTPTGMRLFLSTKAPLRNPDGHVVGIAGIAKEVTEIRKLQDQLAVAARLAAIGTLVAGVSHEVNNPLAGVLAGGGSAAEDVKEARRLLGENTAANRAEATRLLDEALDSLADAQSGSQRVAQIIKDLALFARPNPRRSRERLVDIVRQATRWLSPAIGATATITVEDLGAPDVVVSSGQIGQVLVNLVTNAAKATPPGRKGDVVVRLRPGGPGMARIEVEDHGVGIEPANLNKIFDPFFTTRDVGQGTGLGLPIIHSIVIAHGGTVTVESVVGKGSTFRVELPAAPAEA